MLNAKEIKDRMNGIRDTQKITNAMYLIASTKMQKAKNELNKTKPYFNALHNEIKRTFNTAGTVKGRYFCPSNVSEASDGTYGLLIITADKGLAGAYNKSVIKEAQQLLSKHADTKLFVVGEYGRRFFLQHQIPVEKSFLYTAQNPTMDRARDISALLLELFDKGELDEIFIVYTDIKNNMTTEAVSARLLPFQPMQSAEYNGNGKSTEKEPVIPFEFYPSIDAVLDSVVKSVLSGFIYSALVASFCSEQSDRMTAMHSANRNAEKMLESLSIQYNSVRQAAITQEITEVIASVKAQQRKRKKELLQH
ncbi:MAG: ATP synthase F1 subunit gamma [Eubacteriales bacterium]|jgi:F-type H+-transporting ATPase subunit gamma|nr:ATP synthase F1 subunit gamma [Eubacteriales bacterium]